jgi:phosphoserine aminotransferase
MQNPNFSSGPCSKRPAWSIDALKSAPVGRSHRSALGKERIIKSINDTRTILKIPADYLVGILPAPIRALLNAPCGHSWVPNRLPF